MSEEQQVAYYLRREQDARRLAEDAADPSIQRIHLEMATRYAKLAGNGAGAAPFMES